MTIADRDLTRVMDACRPRVPASVSSAELVRRIGDAASAMLMEGVGTHEADWFDELVARVSRSAP